MPLVAVVFSLTPALSRWERGNRSPLVRKSKAASWPTANGFSGSGQRLFLLPAGEGQDEGENTAVIPGQIKAKPF
jgi:hypothetical protein